MDSLEKKVKMFFSNAKKMKPSEKEAEYEAIRREYYKTLEDADEKVQLANQMYDLVERYLRRLDHELHKFKMELEADNKGITEILEKRSLELDQPPTNSSQKENRYSFTTSRSRDNHGHCKEESLTSKIIDSVQTTEIQLIVILFDVVFKSQLGRRNGGTPMRLPRRSRKDWRSRSCRRRRVCRSHGRRRQIPVLLSRPAISHQHPRQSPIL